MSQPLLILYGHKRVDVNTAINTRREGPGLSAAPCIKSLTVYVQYFCYLLSNKVVKLDKFFFILN